MFKNENLPKVTLLDCSSCTLLHVHSHPPSQRQVWNSRLQDMAREASEISSYYTEIYNPESNTLNHWNKILNTIIPKYYFRNTNYIYSWNMKKKWLEGIPFNKAVVIVNFDHNHRIFTVGLNYLITTKDYLAANTCISASHQRFFSVTTQSWRKS